MASIGPALVGAHGRPLAAGTVWVYAGLVGPATEAGDSCIAIGTSPGHSSEDRRSRDWDRRAPIRIRKGGISERRGPGQEEG